MMPYVYMDNKWRHIIGMNEDYYLVSDIPSITEYYNFVRIFKNSYQVFHVYMGIMTSYESQRIRMKFPIFVPIILYFYISIFIFVRSFQEFVRSYVYFTSLDSWWMFQSIIFRFLKFSQSSVERNRLWLLGLILMQ